MPTGQVNPLFEVDRPRDEFIPGIVFSASRDESMATQLPIIGANPKRIMPEFLELSLSDAPAPRGFLRDQAHSSVNSPNTADRILEVFA